MKKKFDCVAMKNVIQQGLQKRWTGMAGEQRREAIHRDLDASVSAIGKVWRQLASPPRPQLHPASCTTCCRAQDTIRKKMSSRR